jgi:hypothetical protein
MREKVNGKDKREKERQGEVKCARNSTPEDASPKGTVALDFLSMGFSIRSTHLDPRSIPENLFVLFQIPGVL